MKIIEDSIPLSSRIPVRLNKKLVKIAKLKKTTKAELIRYALEKLASEYTDSCK